MYRTLFIIFSIIIELVLPIQVVVVPMLASTATPTTPTSPIITTIPKTEVKKFISDNDVIQLNVGGQLLMTTRSTLRRGSESILGIIFNNQWEERLNRDEQGNIFLDFNPILFEHLLEQLRFIEDREETIEFYPPASFSLVAPFEKMLRKLELMQTSTFRDVRELNVGGEILTTGPKIFDQISNSTTNLFVDSNPQVFRRLINRLRDEEREIDLEPMTTEEYEISTSASTAITIDETEVSTVISTPPPPPTTKMMTNDDDDDDGICVSAVWNPNGTTVAGGHGQGSGLHQLDHPMGLFVDDNGAIYIADTHNHRIMKWFPGAFHGHIIIPSNQSKNYVSKAVVHKNGTIYYCDRYHDRIQQWFNSTEQTILANISCWGLALDTEGSLYISGHDDHRILKWPSQEIVAGAKGEGNANDQLSSPYQIFIDQNQTIYIADYFNHRIMKWFTDLQEGLLVAGGNGYGDSIDQLKLPHAVTVDRMGTMYIVDFGNARIMRWFKHSINGSVIIGNDGFGNRTNQLSDPYDIAFDRQGNLYVADTTNHRIQMYRIDKSACATTLNPNEQ